ncbi:carbon-nitrogen hydrolase family protein [Paroceanicella profunda]|uniref:Carbon-nitrogen hydrolase family protein n=1 Tax=Paroceanicella profunda TaxID=2579971 RepID=A0A5B8FXL9_9RHOB|nr:carbon-nitrogen hydrolase family protein [Paroceanicella profunda]QDL90853.1 carbon-nitrogen hydrolase family protein [Paroceanicella profunda]
MRLSLRQTLPDTGNVSANLGLISRAAKAAARGGAELLLLPELVTTGYGAGIEALSRLAEPADGPTVAALARIAAETGVALIAGFPERAGERVYNSAVFTNGADAPSVYRKSHVYGDYERAVFTAGEPATCLVKHAGITLGLLICYDVEFPENTRRLALAGAELICVPTALPDLPGCHFVARQMIPVRAFENQVFVAYADHAGAEGDFHYPGLSCVAAPDGGILARAGSRPASLSAEIEPAAYAASRAENTYLRDTR